MGNDPHSYFVIFLKTSKRKVKNPMTKRTERILIILKLIFSVAFLVAAILIKNVDILKPLTIVFALLVTVYSMLDIYRGGDHA